MGSRLPFRDVINGKSKIGIKAMDPEEKNEKA
jgi:hypothetical protein